jgi:hypothetical protein
MRKLVATLAVVTALGMGSNCVADTLLPQGGSLNLAIFTDSTTNAILGFDIRGGVQVGIFDPSLNPLGGVLVTDGTAFGLAAPPPPNTLLLATDLGFTQASFIAFSDVTLGGPGALLEGDVTPGSGITDPALLLFDTLGPFKFGFSFLNQQVFSPTELVTNFSLAGIQAQVPEPSTLPFSAAGLVLVSVVAKAIHRRRTNRTQSAIVNG